MWPRLLAGKMLNKNPATAYASPGICQRGGASNCCCGGIARSSENTVLYISSSTSSCPPPAMKNATKNAAAVLAYRIIDDSILSSCCPEAWPEISSEVSWQAAEEAVSISAAIATSSKGNWFMLILILGQTSRNQRNEMKGFQCLGVIWSSRKRSDCYQVMLVCWYNVSRILYICDTLI